MAALGWLLNLGFAGGAAATSSIATLDFCTLTEEQAEALSETQAKTMIEYPLGWERLRIAASEVFVAGATSSEVFVAGALVGQVD